MSEKFTLEIGCAPGGTRPGHLLPGVLEGTGVNLDNVESSKSFGDWEWVIPEDQVEKYKAARETIKSRIENLYNKGVIRYGSW